MRGIDPKTCIYHIYIEQNARPVRQSQQRMNPNLKEIVKEELQKLLNINFIYPISDGQWVSPPVIVPKKKGKWRVLFPGKPVSFRSASPTKTGSYLRNKQSKHFEISFMYDR